LINTQDFGNALVSIATEYNNALLIIENATVGWAAIQQALNRQYQNLFYSSVDLQYVDVENQISNKHNALDKKMVPGFSTTTKTRPLLISNLEMYFREKLIDIRSVRTMNELSTFIWHNGKAQAMLNHNDDLIMSLGIGLWVRDTALKLRQQGVNLTKNMLNNINRVGGNVDPIYKPANLKAHEAWQMNIGKSSSDKKENLNWLL